MELGSMLRMIDSRAWISDRRVAERTDEGTTSSKNKNMSSKEDRDGCIIAAIVYGLFFNMNERYGTLTFKESVVVIRMRRKSSC